MMKLAKQYGPIFRMQVPTEDLVVVCSQHFARLVCDESRFDKKVHGPLKVVRDYAGDGLITAHTEEPNWEKAHRILLPAFGGGSLREMFAPMLDMANQLVLKWERQDPSHPIDVSDDMTRLTVDTIAYCAFSFRLNSFYDPVLHPFVGAMVRGLTESSARTRRPPFASRLMLRKKSQYQRDIETMNALVTKIIAKRKSAEGSGPKDMLSIMLGAQDPITKERLSEENIRYQMVTFLIAGHETTSGLLSFALLELMRSQDAMAKARAEVDRVLGEDAPEYEHLADLTYLDQVLKETLRLWPTAPAFAMKSRAKRTQVEGFTLRDSQTILLLLPAIGRDPSVWENPEAFLPERMEKEKFALLPPGAWMPFGNGQRSCIGRAFALQEAKLALAMVLQRFELHAVNPSAALEVKESLTLKPKDFKITVSSRKAPQSERKARSLGAAAERGTLRIAFGSKTGTAEAFAKQLAAEGNGLGFRCELGILNELHLEAGIPTILLSSSYDGLPPENAKAFFAGLQKKAEGSLSGLQFAVFGCGNKDWHRTYQRVPAKMESRLRELGGAPMIARGEGDAREGAEASFSQWKKALWEVLCPVPLKVEILGIENLGAPATEAAAEALAIFGISPSATLRVIGGAKKTPRDYSAGELFNLLAWDCPVSPQLVAALAAKIPCPPERQKLFREAEGLLPLPMLKNYAAFGITLEMFLEHSPQGREGAF